MRGIELYRAILDLTAPWTVVKVDLDVKGQQGKAKGTRRFQNNLSGGFKSNARFVPLNADSSRSKIAQRRPASGSPPG